MNEVFSGIETLNRFHELIYKMDGLKTIAAHPCNESLVRLLTHPHRGESPNFELEISLLIPEKEIQLKLTNETKIINLKS